MLYMLIHNHLALTVTLTLLNSYLIIVFVHELTA